MSRVKRQFAFARTGFTIGSYIFLAINYYYSSGIDGPVLFSFFVTLGIVVVIHYKRQILFWVLHSAVVAGLLVYEYHFGVVNIYTSRAERFWDIGCVITIMLLLFYVLAKGVLNSYNRERRLAEERAEALDFLHKENNRLFSIISHDLRTPLNTILSYLELLGSQTLDPADKKMLEGQLSEMTRGTSDLLTNLLFWSKSQLEGTRIHLSELAIAGILDSILTVLRPIAQNKSITFNVDIKAAQLVADREMFTIVIRNLMANAIKYSHQGGIIDIRSYQEGNMVVLSIRDFGIGIEADKQATIFTSQVKSMEGTASEHGIGLGLVLCADFVRLQGGKISFESSPGKGSEFSVSFRLRKVV